MQEITIEVQGSAPEPYKVTFVRQSETNLSAYCTCAAGENGQYCKHRFAILDGITADIVSSNANEASIVQSWLLGTDIERLMRRMRELEKEAARIKNELSFVKKDLAKALRD